MARGFAAGVFWGGIVGVLTLTVTSLNSALPVARQGAPRTGSAVVPAGSEFSRAKEDRPAQLPTASAVTKPPETPAPAAPSPDGVATLQRADGRAQPDAATDLPVTGLSSGAAPGRTDAPDMTATGDRAPETAPRGRGLDMPAAETRPVIPSRPTASGRVPSAAPRLDPGGSFVSGDGSGFPVSDVQAAAQAPDAMTFPATGDAMPDLTRRHGEPDSPDGPEAAFTGGPVTHPAPRPRVGGGDGPAGLPGGLATVAPEGAADQSEPEGGSPAGAAVPDRSPDGGVRDPAQGSPGGLEPTGRDGASLARPDRGAGRPTGSIPAVPDARSVGVSQAAEAPAVDPDARVTGLDDTLPDGPRPHVSAIADIARAVVASKGGAASSAEGLSDDLPPAPGGARTSADMARSQTAGRAAEDRDAQAADTAGANRSVGVQLSRAPSASAAPADSGVPAPAPSVSGAPAPELGDSGAPASAPPVSGAPTPALADSGAPAAASSGGGTPSPSPELADTSRAIPANPRRIEVATTGVPGRAAGTLTDRAGTRIATNLPRMGETVNRVSATPRDVSDAGAGQAADMRTAPRSDDSQRTRDTEAGSKSACAASASAGDVPAMVRYAAPYDATPGKPLMAVVLIDDAAGSVDLSALSDFPHPLTIAVDPAREDARAAMERYRTAGFDVVLMADLPPHATARDLELAFESWTTHLPEAVAVMERPGSGLQTSRGMSDHLASILQTSGHGLVLFPKGLDTARKLAAQRGVPAATVFRDIDAEGQTARVIRRFLDHAAFRAGQQGDVVMVGRLRRDTVQALVVWALQDRAQRVALAPVSALLAQAGPSGVDG